MALKHTEAGPLFCGTAATEKETRTKQIKRFALYLVHLTKTRYIILFAFVILSPSFVNVNNKNSLYSFFYPNLSLIFGLCILTKIFGFTFCAIQVCASGSIFFAHFQKTTKSKIRKIYETASTALAVIQLYFTGFFQKFRKFCRNIFCSVISIDRGQFHFPVQVEIT